MKQYNVAISFIRVIAMLSIILGHICTAYGINTYQFGAIGVEIFLFISGYLYGKKNVTNIKKWVVKRWIRLVPPMWIAVLLWITIYFVTIGIPKFSPLISYILCIQGIDRILINANVLTFQGLGQTWFLTVLIVCYVIMLFLKKLPIIENIIEKHSIVSLMLIILLQVIFVFFGVQLSYIIQFFIGYFFSKKDNHTFNEWVSKTSYVILTIASGLSGGARIIANRYIDGTILYDRVIARLSFNVIALWIIAILVITCRFSIIIEIVNSKFWKLLDLLSYPLFLTHYMFLTGPMKVMEWLNGNVNQIIGFVFLTLFTAIIIIFCTSWENVKRVIKS